MPRRGDDKEDGAGFRRTNGASTDETDRREGKSAGARPGNAPGEGIFRRPYAFRVFLVLWAVWALLMAWFSRSEWGANRATEIEERPSSTGACPLAGMARSEKTPGGGIIPGGDEGWGK